MRKIIISICTIAVAGCVSQSKYDRAISTIDSLRTENARLTQLNEELENGETRLAALYSQYVSRGKYIKAEETYSNAVSRHPQANNNPAYIDINIVRQRAQQQRDSIKKAERDSLFLANINDIGEWRIGNYVNDFKEPTGEHYLYQVIYGKFSNSATAGSRLGVTIMIYKSRSLYSKSGIDYTIEFDEYNDGTKDESILWNAKAVCTDLRKVYIASYGRDFYDREEGENSKKYSFLDLLRMENNFEVTDTHREYSLNTVYNFTVNSQKLNNALVKAGILSVDEALKSSHLNE